MTNEDKADCRRLVREGRRSDQEIADYCDCTVATVRRYRKVLTK